MIKPNVTTITDGKGGNVINPQKSEENINLEDISILYTTEKTEENRTSFNETYNQTAVSDDENGAKFLNGLTDNKSTLCEKLNITEEQYDSLACIALALSSQETGMGHEKGYVSENTGFGGFLRKVLKQIDIWTGGASASSGMTQMKIYDFLNGSALTEEQKKILTDYGINAKNGVTNNLYSNPDKAAIATIIVLNSIASNYDEYINELKNSHNEIGVSISGISNSELLSQGNKILSEISNTYKNAEENTQKQIRRTFKNLLLSTNGSKIGDKGVDKEYNEEYQINEFNKLLGTKYTDDDINKIRYALTANGQEMSITEYCAYGWNKGTTGTGMQLDRLLAEKIGTILATPEDFDYDQFTVNVSTLAEKYANQSVSNGLEAMNNALDDMV